MGTTFAWSPDVVSMLTHWALPFLVVLGVLVAFMGDESRDGLLARDP